MPKKETTLFSAVLVTILLFRLWLITGIPKLIGYNSLYDDLYFAKAAHYIIYGQWMGPYSQITLIKAPFYSLFLVFSFLSGLPLFFNETIFFIGACLVLYYSLSPLIKNRWWRLLLFVYMLYIPASLATSWNVRVYREFIYSSLTLYVVAFSIGLFLRLDRKIPELLLWSMGLGLSMGAFMITREEGVWIYPVLFLFLVCCLFFIFMKKMNWKAMRLLLILLPILLWQLPGIIISYFNYTHYGFWGISENLDPDFNRVINALGRIKTGVAWHPTIQIPKEVRMKAYEASPLFSSIKDPLEGLLLGWNISEDGAMQMKPKWFLSQYGDGGIEMSNGHFIWVLREAVAGKGYYASGRYPREFYRQLADQLESVCNDGLLACSSARSIPFIGSIDPRHYPIITRMFFEGIIRLLKLDYIPMETLDVQNWPDSQAGYYEPVGYFDEFTYDSIPAPRKGVRNYLQYHLDGKLDLRLKIIFHKEKLMAQIYNVYKWITPLFFTTGFVVWIGLILLVYRNRGGQSVSVLTISSFVLGLFFSRFMTLSIIDATTSAAGREYSESLYVFIYLFSFMMIFWAICETLQIVRRQHFVK